MVEVGRGEGTGSRWSIRRDERTGAAKAVGIQGRSVRKEKGRGGTMGKGKS